MGEINAFGQQLSITEGGISFPNIPADNPHLDIRAERQIYGNSEIRRAGVFVNGTVQRMVVEPYTDPMTTRERAQTLADHRQRLQYGTRRGRRGHRHLHCTPYSFSAYGIGVFEDENVISLRYDLSREMGGQVDFRAAYIRH